MFKVDKDYVLPNKKVKLRLVGQDGNAFSLMGQFQRQARREGWTTEEVGTVINACTAGDYNDLLGVLIQVCKDPDESGELGDD